MGPTNEEIRAFKAYMADFDIHDPVARRALAVKVLRYIEEDIKMDDMEALMVDSFNFEIGQTPQWTFRKGLKAFVHQPGTYAPRSEYVQKVLTVGQEQVSVHPAFELNELRAGRYGQLTDVRRDAVNELLGRKNAIIFNTLIGSIGSGDANYGTFASGATDSAKISALDAALTYVEDACPGGVKAIVGRHQALGFMTNSGNWSEETKRQLEVTGQFGAYRGYPLVKLSQYTDGYGNRRISENEIMVIGFGSTRLARTQGLEVLEDIDTNNKIWHMRIDEMYGVATHHARFNYRIQIT